MSDPYMEVHIPQGEYFDVSLNGKYDLTVKMDDEGIVIDLYDVNGEVCASTWASYSELDAEDEDEE